jgi:hypothetical protein
LPNSPRVPAGTYVGLNIAISPTFQVLINDPVNGFFSSPAAPLGISTALPAGQPSYLFSPVANGPSQAWNTSPAVSPSNQSGFRGGRYLGLDGLGNLCWADPVDYTYAQYAQLRRMPVVTTLGGSTTLSILTTATVPAPASGSTYASGCPTFASTSTVTLVLAAN